MDKQIPNKLFFKIGEVCEITDTQPYVLRYWESEFQALAPAKNSSGQRIYRRKDIETVLRIKQLLYDEGFTIAGAKKRLEVELSGRGTTPQAMASLPETEVADVEADEPADASKAVAELRALLVEVRSELRGMLTLLEKGGRKGN
jgi:DNA-binding transcriptional MerR regulator